MGVGACVGEVGATVDDELEWLGVFDEVLEPWLVLLVVDDGLTVTSDELPLLP